MPVRSRGRMRHPCIEPMFRLIDSVLGWGNLQAVIAWQTDEVLMARTTEFDFKLIAKDLAAEQRISLPYSLGTYRKPGNDFGN